MISLVCPIYNEEKYIDVFLKSIIKQDYPKKEMEVLLVDGMSTDNTRNIISKYLKKYPLIHLLDNPQRTSSYAMNIGIKAAQGEYIIRMDAHADYPLNYLKLLVHYSKTLENAQNVGGVCITLPCNKTNEALAISEVLSSPFGMGNSYFRTGTDQIKQVDTVPFGCFKKTLFDKIGYFDTELIRNQDDEFNGRIIRNGGNIYLIPDIRIKYFARDKVAKIRKMFYQYGLYKPLVNKKLGAPATIRQFFPLLFLLGLVIGGIISIFLFWARYIYLFVISLYLLIGLILGGMVAIRSDKPTLILWMPYVFLSVHLSYGWGYLCGLYKIAFKKRFNVKYNR
jgi:glycosyltransferase involved in cell wall biosynthesis